MPVSANKGQITKADVKEFATILRTNPKMMNWKAIGRILLTYQPNKRAAPNLDGLLRQALHRACLNQPDRRLLTLILQKLKNLSLPERVQFASTAVQCRNIVALQAIIYDDSSVLYYSSHSDDDYDYDDESDDRNNGSCRGVTLLHLACERYGWSNEIKFILKEILEHNENGGDNCSKNYHHKGLFHEREDSEMPLTLALHAGSDLPEIIYFLRSEHPVYLRKNLQHVSKIIAEYWHDMELLSDLIRWYGGEVLNTFHPGDGSSPLSHACYYQNQSMILCLLNEYLDYYQCHEFAYDGKTCLHHVQKRLLSQNEKSMSPLGNLLLCTGDPDSENVWRCIDCCIEFFANFYEDHSEDERRILFRTKQPQFPILHLFLVHSWDQLLTKKNCMEILERIVKRLEIDVCCVDKAAGNTLLSIVIEKMATQNTVNDRKKTRELALQILEYFLHPPAVGSHTVDMCPAATRDRVGRLPLHSACDQTLQWKMGLESIVNAHMSALESFDPISGLPPFAHYAIGKTSELDSIYTLLRLHPACLDSMLSRANTT